MAPRIRVLTSGGVPPATLNGETLYAGKVGCIGSGKHATDKSYLYRARKLQQELDERYGGDMKKMEKKYGFHPAFVQWRQEESTGGFEQIELDKIARIATAKAARLEQIAFQIQYPLAPEVHATILRGNHGTTPLYLRKMQVRTAKTAHKRTKMQYLAEMGRCQTAERAASCMPKIESEIIRGTIQYPQRPPKTPRAEAKLLSPDAVDGLNKLVWKLEDDFPTLSMAFKMFDKDRSGCITTPEFRRELDKLYLQIPHEAMDEIMAFIDVNGDGQLELHEIQACINEVMVEVHKNHWMDRTKKYYTEIDDAGARRKQAIVEAVPTHVIVESVNTKACNRMQEMQASFNFMRTTSFAALTQTIGGAPRSAYVSKSEMARIFFKSNISLLPTHFDVWWDSLIKIEGYVKWATFKGAIGHGRWRGRGSFVTHDIPEVDIIADMARSPEIACLRSPDILSSPNRWELCGTFRHPSGAGFDNRRFDGQTYVIGATKNTGGSRADMIPLSDRAGVRKLETMQSLPLFPHPDRRFGSDHLTSKLRPAEPQTMAKSLGADYQSKQKSFDEELLQRFVRSGPLFIMPADTERRVPMTPWK